MKNNKYDMHFLFENNLELYDYSKLTPLININNINNKNNYKISNIIYILLVTKIVLFPNVIMPIVINDIIYIKKLKKIFVNNNLLGVVTKKK